MIGAGRGNKAAAAALTAKVFCSKNMSRVQTIKTKTLCGNPVCVCESRRGGRAAALFAIILKSRGQSARIRNRSRDI